MRYWVIVSPSAMRVMQMRTETAGIEGRTSQCKLRGGGAVEVVVGRTLQECLTRDTRAVKIQWVACD